MLSDKEIDLRVIKTKQAIKNSLYELIENSGFGSITVKALTEKAQINRGTFYLHYENIEDLISEYYDDFIVRLYDLFDKSILEQRSSVIVSDSAGATSILIINMLQFIKENRSSFKLLWLRGYHLSNREKIKVFVEDILFNHEEALLRMKKLPAPKKYYFSYVFSSCMGIIAEWIDNDCAESVEDIAKILTILNFNGVNIR